MKLYKPDIPKFDSKTIFKNEEEDYYSVNLDTFPFKLDKIPKNESFKCCLIKITNHIPGNIYFENKSLIFIETNPNEEEIKKYDLIDDEKKFCFGNLIKSKTGNGYFKRINYEEIYLVLPRVYYYHKSGCELYTNLNKSFFFKFKDEKTAEDFYDKISKIINQNEKDLNKLFSDYQKAWKQNKISNLEYIMWLNIFSNRSYRDITQYPVFPWILQDYNLEEKSILNLKSRDFSLPLGMMEITEKGKKRKEKYLESYKIMYNDLNMDPPAEKSFFSSFYTQKKINLDEIEYDKIPYIFGSHFSNSAYTSHYLVRLFPFTLTGIEIQGNSFDAPDRLFININKSFLNTVSEKSDLREIIPEFFALPEMFINLNNLNLGKLQKNNKEDSTYTIIKNKRNLNNDEPVFVDEVLLPCENNPYIFVSEYRILLEKKEKIKKWIDLTFGIYADHENAELKKNLYSSYCYNGIIIKRINENKIDKDELIPVYRLFELGFNPIPFLKVKSEKTGSFSFFDNYNLNNSSSFLLSHNCNELTSKENEKENEDIKESRTIKLYNSECHSIHFSIDRFKIFGCKSGSLFVFIHNYEKPFKIIKDHSKEIIDITGNETLKLFADISKDGLINIYSLPECELIRSIYVIIKYDEFKKVYLSASPLPSVLIETELKLISYSINGKFLKEFNKDNPNIKVTGIKSDNFIDYIEFSNMTKLELPYFKTSN